MVVRPAVDRAGARKRQPDREPWIAARNEPRREQKTPADQGDREHTTRHAEQLAERREQNRRSAGAARRDVRAPRAEPVRVREPARHDERAADDKGEDDKPLVANVGERGDPESQRGPYEELRFREQRERGKPGAARTAGPHGQNHRRDR